MYEHAREECNENESRKDAGMWAMEAAMGIEHIEPYTVWRSRGSGVVAANGGDVLETAAVEGEGGYDRNCMR